MTAVKRKGEESAASLLRRREVNKLNTGFLLLGAVFVIMISSALARSQHLPTDQTPGVHQTEPTREQRESGSSQIQESHTTSMNRYPDEYSFVERYIYSQQQQEQPSKKFLRTNISVSDKKRVLSFGASTGLEAISLATLYFNETNHDDVTIYGVDLHQPSLDAGEASVVARKDIKDGKVIFFNGKEVEISEYGPYDAIFANSVLCLHGKKGGYSFKEIMEKYSYQSFEHTIGYLDASLKVGGILAIVNMSYEFSDTDVSKRYRALSKCSNFVPKVLRDKGTLEAPKTLLDCVWVKES